MSDSNLIGFPGGQLQAGPSQVPPEKLNPKQLLEEHRLALISNLQYIRPLAEDEYFKSKLGFSSKPSSTLGPDGNPIPIEITPKEALELFEAMLVENLAALKRLESTGLIV
jgi:hypothetical protein